MQLENLMLMYGIYNAETLEKLINTVHNIHNMTSLYCVGFSFCLSYPLMTQGLIFSMNRTKIVLDHKLLPRSPTMAFSSVRENVTLTPSWNCVGKYYCLLYVINDV